MTKAAAYRTMLQTLDDWEPYLLAQSGLPGPRGNLELAQVVADLGDLARFEQLLTYTPNIAPTNTPQEFLALCGVIGLGRLVAEGQDHLLARIRGYAHDPRWRMREGVSMALQRVGDADMDRLIGELQDWLSGSLLEQRAVAAALCEPRLLRAEPHARRTLELLDAITTSLTACTDRRSEAFMALRKGLGYCWSVAVVTAPDVGKPFMEKWLGSDDKDVRWIMRQNLGKARLVRMDAAWVERCLRAWEA